MEYVIDGYLVVPRISNLNPNDYLDYLVDSDLKGIRTIPQLEKVREVIAFPSTETTTRTTGSVSERKKEK